MSHSQSDLGGTWPFVHFAISPAGEFTQVKGESYGKQNQVVSESVPLRDT